MKRTKMISIAAALVLAVSASVPAFAAANDRLVVSYTTNTSTTTAAPAAQTSSVTFLSMKGAMDLALKEVPGVLKSIEFDIEDNGSLRYKAEIHYNNKEYDLEFSATDGTIYQNKQDTIEWDEAIPAGSYITYEKAAEVALGQVKGGFVSKLTLESRWNDGVVYDAEVWLNDAEYTIVIDADNGTVLRSGWEKESDASYYTKNLAGAQTVATLPDKGTSSTTTTPPAASTPSTPQVSKPTQTTGSITMDKAREIAQAQVPNGRVTDVEYEYEHGRAVYEVEVKEGYYWEYKFVIDASNGSILFTEKEYDD